MGARLTRKTNSGNHQKVFASKFYRVQPSSLEVDKVKVRVLFITPELQQAILRFNFVLAQLHEVKCSVIDVHWDDTHLLSKCLCGPLSEHVEVDLAINGAHCNIFTSAELFNLMRRLAYDARSGRVDARRDKDVDQLVSQWIVVRVFEAHGFLPVIHTKELPIPIGFAGHLILVVLQSVDSRVVVAIADVHAFTCANPITQFHPV